VAAQPCRYIRGTRLLGEQQARCGRGRADGGRRVGAAFASADATRLFAAPALTVARRHERACCASAPGTQHARRGSSAAPMLRRRRGCVPAAQHTCSAAPSLHAKTRLLLALPPCLSPPAHLYAASACCARAVGTAPAPHIPGGWRWPLSPGRRPLRRRMRRDGLHARRAYAWHLFGRKTGRRRVLPAGRARRWRRACWRIHYCCNARNAPCRLHTRKFLLASSFRCCALAVPLQALCLRGWNRRLLPLPLRARSLPVRLLRCSRFSASLHLSLTLAVRTRGAGGNNVVCREGGGSKNAALCGRATCWQTRACVRGSRDPRGLYRRGVCCPPNGAIALTRSTGSGRRPSCGSPGGGRWRAGTTA